MDTNLPNMSGHEAVRRLRSSDATKNIPVIALSANAMEKNRQDALAAGCNVFMTKPVDVAELMTQLKGLLGQRQS